MQEIKSPAIVSSPPPWLAAGVADALAMPADCAVALAAIAGDAGSRRYYRASVSGKSYMAVVDSSLAQQQCFVQRRQAFAAAGVRVPAVLAEKEKFLLLEDFGDTTYRRRLPAAAEHLYAAALDTLVMMQQNTALAAALPPYEETLLQDEMQLFSDWYCARHLARPLPAAAVRVLQAARQFLAEAMLSVAQIAVHRDYHSRNLMVLAEGKAPGVLDFQDAVCGSALYDVASLLRDAYIEWQPPQQQRWLRQYWQKATAAGIDAGQSFEECWQRFNIAGAQRGLKVLGIFARLAHRDNKQQYLGDLPLVHRHLTAACAALPPLAALATLINDYPPP